MNRDWEKKGYLDGLTLEEKDIIGGWLNQIDFDSMINERAREIIFAVLRQIYVSIARERNQSILIKDYPDRYPADKILSMVNAKEVASTYDNYCEHFEPEGEKWLTSLDAGAELCVLFCNNYVMSLICKQEKINLSL